MLGKLFGSRCGECHVLSTLLDFSSLNGTLWELTSKEEYRESEHKNPVVYFFVPSLLPSQG